MKKIISLLAAAVLMFFVSGCTEKALETKKLHAEYSEGYAGIHMELPEGWTYEPVWIMKSEETGYERGGIEFWPEDQPDARMGLYYYSDSYAICGTGPKRENLTFTSGHEAVLYWEDLGDLSYAYVFYQNTPGEYLFEAHYVPTEFWNEERETILAILDSAVVGGNALSENEALALAEAECEKYYPHHYRNFDYLTGQWTFRFYVVPSLIKQTVVVNPDGTIAP